MSLPKACCTLPPVESNYEPKGIEIQFGDFKIYETGPQQSDKMLLCIYDIFGVHPVTKQFCDKLASSGVYRVIMPDFFRGKPYPVDKFPPKEMKEVMDFVGTSGSWENVVKGDVTKILEHYKAQGVKEVGAFGFCWGSKMCVETSVDFGNCVKAIVLIHPSFVSAEDGDRVKTPVLALPTKDDSDMVPFYERVKARFGEEGSGHHRFEDIHHGFAAARGNMEDPLNRKRMEEALSMTYDFFERNLK